MLSVIDIVKNCTYSLDKRPTWNFPKSKRNSTSFVQRHKLIVLGKNAIEKKCLIIIVNYYNRPPCFTCGKEFPSK